jgi:methylated-DNA-protein-cysteine methyltransferase-like protein
VNESPDAKTIFPRIYEIASQIPRGRVSTYGQIAALVGAPCDARLVGWAMASLPEGSDVPWQRVINSQGKISLKGMSGQVQRMRLEAEGIVFDERGRVNLRRFGWPDEPAEPEKPEPPQPSLF